MAKLFLVRHGESRWNEANRFTGWVDVPLSSDGIKEALKAASELKKEQIDVAFTSTLERSQETLLIILSEQDQTGIFQHTSGKEKKWSNHKAKKKDEIPVHVNWRLNERYYGDLQGLNKDSARKKWGRHKVFTWRRSWDTKPPGGESLKDTSKRVLPYFKKEIMPLLKKRKNVLVAGHGNSLRAIIKFIENISEEDVPFLEVPTGKPLTYEYKYKKFTKQY